MRDTKKEISSDENKIVQTALVEMVRKYYNRPALDSDSYKLIKSILLEADLEKQKTLINNQFDLDVIAIAIKLWKLHLNINKYRTDSSNKTNNNSQELARQLNAINSHLVSVQDRYPSHLNTMVNVILAVIFSPLTALQWLGHQAMPQLISDSTWLRDRGGRNAYLMCGAKQNIELTVAQVKKELGIEPDGKVRLISDLDTGIEMTLK